MLTSWWRRVGIRSARTAQAGRQPLQKNRSRLRLEGLEDRTLLTTTSEVFVAVLYRDILQRAPEPAGLSFWASKLDTGTSSTEIVQGIETSLEHRMDEVQGLYRSLLRREGDPQGIGFWAHFMQSGATLVQVEVIFITSTEFVSQNGPTSSQQFLSEVYLVVLNRSIDPTGAAGWGALMASGTSATTVVTDIEESPEAVADNLEGMYERDLHRKGDPQGLKGWEKAMSQGEDSEQIEESMLSTETIQQIDIFVVQVTNLSTQTAVQVAQSYLSAQPIPAGP
jgi:Domain of unknown function (DUF4214)